MDTTTDFTEFKLSNNLLESLAEQGFKNPTPIQAMTIGPILDGKDILAMAETGSGKTGSFAIPIIEQLLREEIDNSVVQYVILSPTRELAQQTHKVFNTFGGPLGIRSACFIGGESIDRQKEHIAKGVTIMIATPGRLCDLIKQKCAKLQKLKALVFDEADRLFDMGFQKEIEFILKQAPKDRQLIMVSATTNNEVIKTAYKFHSDPLELKLNEDSLLVDNIDHELAMIDAKEKMSLLVDLIRKKQDAYAIVFCNTQVQTHRVAEWLKKMDLKAMPISGRLPQNKRTKLMDDFRSKAITILVCTDVAARGLDIKDVNLVINYDLPHDAENYVHRIGRTGRAGKEGKAISFCAYEDCENLDAITELIGEKIPKMALTDDNFAKDICPMPRIDSKTLRLVSDKREKPAITKAKGKKVVDKKYKKVETMLNPQHSTYKNENNDRRVFDYTTASEQSARSAALGHFKINDNSLLDIEVIKKGRRKFILFGSRTNTYRLVLRPIYKRLLTPFLMDIIKLMRLRLYVKVGLKGNNVAINFSGQDERLLTKNNNELLNALEQLAKTYLSNKVKLETRVRVNAQCSESKKQEKGLLQLVDKLKKKVLDTGEVMTLRPLNASDRRIVHQHLSADKEVETNSLGDGRLKKIEIRLKN